MTGECFLQQYCAHMNPQQLEAVQAVDGPVLLLAVPGSGKTTVLIARLGYMVYCCGIPAENILTMTYTVAATREMQRRFAEKFGAEYAHALEIRTINGLSQKIIDYYCESEQRDTFQLQENNAYLSKLIRSIYLEFYSEYPSESVIRDIRTAITFCKNSMYSQKEVQEYDMGMKCFPEIYSRYCAFLKQNRMMDYDDQILYALNILKSRPAILSYYQDRYRYLCVDESQDTSRLQHEMIHLLAKKNNHLFMVGDEDQSIYGFRAAYPDALNHFEETYPDARVLFMEQNYRSAEPIIAAANRFVAQNKFRHPKSAKATRGDGNPVQVIPVSDRRSQFHFLFEYAKRCASDTAILFRNNDSAVPLIDYFERHSIPYRCRQLNEAFFSHRIIQDVTDIILFSLEQTNEERFLRIYYKLGCMISKSSAEYACAQSRKTGKPILMELIRTPNIGEYTMHSITELYEAMQQLPKASATDALSLIQNNLRYGAYLEQNKLDKGKFDILGMLAVHVGCALELLNRLDELRILIRDHISLPDTSITLSTIHSGKGLEYDSVYLVDALDGILPSLPSEQNHTKEQIRQYEEERRLFYVAITRAKKELNLFCVEKSSSEFVSEVSRNLPAEITEEKDFLPAFPQNPCGMQYYHQSLGKGIIRACAEQGILVEFANQQRRLFTVTEMLLERKRRMGSKQPDTPPVIKKNKKLQQGSRVTHTVYGTGMVTGINIETITVRFDSDGKNRSFLKSSVIPTSKLHLL